MNPVLNKKIEKLIMSTLVHLENLPEELLIIIIKFLDFKSVFNLYQTCYRMQNVIKMPGVLKVCNLSLSTLATIKTLQQKIIKDISAHLYELNVSGLLDLTATSLISAVKKMKNLKILNMSYTNITLEDFLDIYKVCPTIENISINLLFKDPKKLFKVSENLQRCQEVFQKLTDIHFIVRFDFATNFSILNDNPMKILQGSSKNNLRFTIYNWAFTFCMENICEICFDHLAVSISSTNPTSCHWTNNEAFDPLLKTEMFEYIVILHDIKTSIWITPLFENFFNENFNISKWKFVTLNICKPEEIIEGNYSIFFWRKDKTKFDNTFFSHLRNKIKSILPYYIHIKGEDICEADLSNIDTKYYFDWCRIYQFLPESKSVRGDDCSEPNFKKRRIVKPSIILNYDNIFCDQKTVKLSIIFPVSGIVSLMSGSDYLRKLTYLSLEGDYVMYSNEFFNILFRSCENLTTLNVEASSVCRCCQAIVRSIPLSRSIKNIRLIDKRIDFNTLFLSFSQCTTLENIYVVDSSSEFSTINDPTPMFKKCINLYSLYIRGQMSTTKMKTFTKILNVAKKRCLLNHLNIILQTPNNKCDLYNPYMKVFALNTIKQK